MYIKFFSPPSATEVSDRDIISKAICPVNETAEHKAADLSSKWSKGMCISTDSLKYVLDSSSVDRINRNIHNVVVGSLDSTASQFTDNCPGHDESSIVASDNSILLIPTILSVLLLIILL